VTVADAQTITGVKTFDNGLATDTISEETSAAGVTIDSVLLKDGLVGIGADGSASAPSIYRASDTNTGIFFPAADQVAIATNGVERVNLGNSATVFNDGGGDVDFRVEGDTDANLLFVDASADRIGINKSAPDTKLNIGFTGADAVNTLRIEGSNGSSERYALDIQADGANALAKFLIGTGNGAPTERMRIDSNSNLFFNSGYGSVAVAYGCRAWVNFNGTGTVAIREDGNVSSITDDGTGVYTVNFTTAMPDGNYSVSASTMETGSTGITDWSAAIRRNTNVSDSMATTFVKVAVFTAGSAVVDAGVVVVSVFR
jgi:hypothetical protein